MFNQIALHPKDQPYHRFLWRDGDENIAPKVYQWLRVIFGDKPSPDLAGYCIRLLAKLGKEQAPIAADVLAERTYVDDICHSESTPEATREVIQQTDQILSKGSFSVKAWHSNHSEVDAAPEERIIDVLGHTWD